MSIFSAAESTRPLFGPDSEIDDETEQKTDNPYPGSDKPQWVARFSDALAAATGLPPEICDTVAAYVVRPKQYLQAGRNGMPDTLRPGCLSKNAEGQTILTVQVHGFAGNAGEYNERIRRSFDAPFKPGADLDRVLPTLMTGRTAAGTLAPYITTAQPVPHDRINHLLGAMGQALDVADGTRGYRLDEDIHIYGQQEPTLHAVLLRQISEPDGVGGTRVRQMVDLTAIKGANRSRARLKLFELTPEKIVYGVDPHGLVGLPPRAPSAEARVWVRQYADLLRQAWQDPAAPGHEIAKRAEKIATVTMQIIVGSPILEEFHNSTFDPNRVDHRRPPLDYSMAEKASSDMRALLRDCKALGTLSEAERAWLAGEGPDPAPVQGESLVDARDRRDQQLLDILFPPSGSKARSQPRQIRYVLSEPYASQTTGTNVSHRTRMFSSAASDGYSTRWNPRVLDGLYGARTIKDGVTFAGTGTWSELLDAAESGNLDALDVFIMTRGVHWLAEHGIVEADRGSVGAQTNDGDDARVRRSMSNVSTAMKADPLRAVAVFRELAHAANTATRPRTVDIVTGADDVPMFAAADGTVMTREWFTVHFPKTNGKRTRRPQPDERDPEPTPAQPAPSPQQKLLFVRDAFVQAVTETLMEAVAGAMHTGTDLVEAAAAAGQVPLPENVAEATEQVEKALNAAKRDVLSLMANISGLKLGESTADDFESKTAQLLDEVSE